MASWQKEKGVGRGMSINPKEIYEKLLEAGEHWADADAAASMLEETLRVLKSKLMLASEQSSIAAKEADAYASSEYEKHVKDAVVARQEANRARVRWISAQTLVDLKRTEAASERAAQSRG